MLYNASITYNEVGTAYNQAESAVVNGTATPSGVSVSSVIGTATTSADATIAVNGVSVSSQIGTVTASGEIVVNGTATPSGVSVSAQIGVVSINGSANVYPIGILAFSDVGTVSASGSAEVSVLGVSVDSLIGSIISPDAVVNANVIITGVQCYSMVGVAMARSLKQIDISFLYQTISPITATLDADSIKQTIGA